jgi:serine/threonine-protein kinase HipA
MEMPERIRQLDVEIAGPVAGQLIKGSIYEFRYRDADDARQPALSLVMPPSRPTYQDGDLFPVLDQSLPEGELYLQLRAMFPKQNLTPMHLLSLIGSNGIGRLGFRLPDAPPTPRPPTIDRATLLATKYTPEVFGELVNAYLATGAGIAGMQPKIMVPDRPTVPIPTLIVKAGSPAYPGLAANEFLCLSAARRAGIEVADFELSNDGQMLILDRFDIRADGSRLGFEDIAALMGLRVRDIQSDRKYQGSYERVAELLLAFRLPAQSLQRFFEQVALTVMVRNGDGHLKNFGVLYTDETDCRLAPLFDVVTTSIYRYRRFAGGPELEDHTLALKMFKGKGRTRGYPGVDELPDFGRRVCGVAKPDLTLERIADAMGQTLQAAHTDERIPKELLAQMRAVWERGRAYATSRP